MSPIALDVPVVNSSAPVSVMTTNISVTSCKGWESADDTRLGRRGGNVGCTPLERTETDDDTTLGYKDGLEDDVPPVELIRADNDDEDDDDNDNEVGEDFGAV